MLEQIFQAFLMQGILPELLALIDSHFKQTGTLPTLEELQASFNAKADSVIANGTSWMKIHLM
jgi:hypothetical protein